MLSEQRGARELIRRGPSSVQDKKAPRPAISEPTATKIEEVASSHASKDEDKPLSPRVSPSSQIIATETVKPDALELSPGSDSAIEKSSSSYAGMDGNEEHVLPLPEEQMVQSSEPTKENRGPPSLDPRREHLSVHDSVIENRPLGLKPVLSGPPSSSSRHSERSGSDHDDKSSVHGSVIGTYDWRSEPPLKQQPDSIYEAYVSKPLRPEDDYMMSGGLGPGSPAQSPVRHTEERGRRLLPAHEGVETQFSSLERVAVNDLPLESQSGTDNEESTHITIKEPEKPVHEHRKSRGRSLSKTKDRLMDYWHNLYHGDQGKYPMNHHRSMKYSKKSQARSGALPDTKVPPKEVSARPGQLEPFPPFQAEPLQPEPPQYEPPRSEPLKSSPLQSESRTSRARPRVAQSHSPPPFRTRPPPGRVARSHSPPPLRAEARRTHVDSSRSQPPFPPRAQRTRYARSTRSEERHDPGVQPPWMPDMTDYEGSDGARYYWLDPEVIAEKEEEARYRKLEADAAMNLWKTNFRAKPYVKPSLPVAGGAMNEGISSSVGLSALHGRN